jgi:hypothetical protein
VSSDVYLDVYPVDDEGFLTHGSRPKTLRISYLSNLVAGCTLDLFDSLRRIFGGQEPGLADIEVLLLVWERIYALVKKPENAADCYMPDDIVSPDEIREFLRPFSHARLYIRVD